MAYREKSAWVMAALMFVTGLFYVNTVVSASLAIGKTAPPIGIFIAYVFLAVIGSIVVAVALAVTSPKEANAPADERERPALDRAGNISGVVLGVGAITSLLYYLAQGDGNLLFHLIMGSVIVSQISEYVLQIILLRRSS